MSMAYLQNRVCSGATVGEPYAWSEPELAQLFTQLPAAAFPAGYDPATRTVNARCRDAAWAISQRANLQNAARPWLQQARAANQVEIAAQAEINDDLIAVERWIDAAVVRIRAMAVDIRQLRAAAADPTTRAQLAAREADFVRLAGQLKLVTDQRDQRYQTVKALRARVGTLNLNGIVRNANGNGGGLGGGGGPQGSGSIILNGGVHNDSIHAASIPNAAMHNSSVSNMNPIGGDATIPSSVSALSESVPYPDPNNYFRYKPDGMTMKVKRRNAPTSKWVLGKTAVNRNMQLGVSTAPIQDLAKWINAITYLPPQESSKYSAGPYQAQ